MGPMRVMVDADELAALRAENRRLTGRVQELLDSNNAMVDERRESLQLTVMHFMRCSEQPMLTRPGVPSDDLVRFRWKIHVEEVWEGLRSCFAFYDERTAEMTRGLMDRLISHSRVRVDLVELADALGDIDYISEGTRLTFGIDGGPVAAEIHRSNLAKVVNGILRNEIGKIVKPPGWTPPDILGVLKAQGYQPPPPEVERDACAEIERAIDETAVAALRALRAKLAVEVDGREVPIYPGHDFTPLLQSAIRTVLPPTSFGIEGNDVEGSVFAKPKDDGPPAPKPSWVTGEVSSGEWRIIEARLLKWLSAVAPDGKHPAIVYANCAAGSGELVRMIDILLERRARGGLEFVDPTPPHPAQASEATS